MRLFSYFVFMALSRKTESGWKAHIPSIILWGYVVLSALFIIWTLFSMLRVGVYQAGYNTGANQAALDIATQSMTQTACQNGISLPTSDGKRTVLVNTICFNQASATGATDTVK